jgi:hypothetical protein
VINKFRTAFGITGWNGSNHIIALKIDDKIAIINNACIDLENTK